MTEKPSIAVIGAGLMGHGIAQVFAVAGLDVAISDPFPAAREAVHTKVGANLDMLGQDRAALARIAVHAEVAAAVAQADLVIEAAPENLELKQELFREIERHAKPSAVLASNTSVIPITQIMEKLSDKRRALGTHWWNPPFLVPLVEVIRTADTCDQATVFTIDLLAMVGKTPVEVAKDVPGFVGNRLQHALWREAIALVADGVCDARTVDTVVKASFGRRLAVLGPLENADLVGIELTRAIHGYVLPHLDATPGASPYLDALIDAGKLGFKSGEGFQNWTEDQQAELRRRVTEHLTALNRAGI